MDDQEHQFKKLNLSLTSPEDLRNRELALENARQFQAYAASRAALMFGCYRKSEASDPEVYAAATSAILSEYPQEVIDYITDPRTGLPSRSQWLPSVFEVRRACDDHIEYLHKVELVRAKRAAQSR
jgi:hypothetical protein